MFFLETKKIPKILIVGDLMIDHYIWGLCERISPEAPVQVVEIKNESNRLGGACNVANNLVALGANVSICGVVGDDLVGKEMIGMLKNLGVNTDYILVDNNITTTQKTRIMAGNQQVLRVDKENREQNPKIDSLIDSISVDEFDGVILSDYGKGVLSDKITRELIHLANLKNKIILCDPKGRDYSKYANATLLTPNKKEAKEATGIDILDRESLFECIRYLKEEYHLKYSLITLSEEGIGIFNNDKLDVIPTFAQEVYDVTGAGDTVISALCFALSKGGDIYSAIRFANAAAAVAVGKVGSATASIKEISTHLCSRNIFEKKIISQNDIDLIVGEKVVFTNGCFDIIHRGHVEYLQESKRLGDVLVVGLNSDESVRRLKGNDRPINNQEDRAYVLASMEFVDYVVIFDEDTPSNLIENIKPYFLVKGSDYEGKEIAGSEFVKEVRLIDFVDGKSTSNIVKKIRKD